MTGEALAKILRETEGPVVAVTETWGEGILKGVTGGRSFEWAHIETAHSEGALPIHASDVEYVKVGEPAEKAAARIEEARA